MTKTMLDDLKQMLQDKVPSAEITKRLGVSANELVVFRRAWNIKPYGTPGPKRKQIHTGEKR